MKQQKEWYREENANFEEPQGHLQGGCMRITQELDKLPMLRDYD